MFFSQIGKRPELYYPFDTDTNNHSYCSGSYPTTAIYAGSIQIESGAGFSDYGENVANFYGSSYTGLRIGNTTNMYKQTMESGSGFTVSFRWRARNIGGGSENVFYYGLVYNGSSLGYDTPSNYATAWKSTGTYKFINFSVKQSSGPSLFVTNRDINQLTANTWYDAGYHASSSFQYMLGYSHGTGTYYNSQSMVSPFYNNVRTYSSIGNYGTVAVNGGFGYDGYIKDYQVFANKLSEVESYQVRKNNGRLKV